MLKVNIAQRLLNEVTGQLVALDVAIRTHELKIRLKEYNHVKKQLIAEINALKDQRTEIIIEIEGHKQLITDYLMEERTTIE